MYAKQYKYKWKYKSGYEKKNTSNSLISQILNAEKYIISKKKKGGKRFISMTKVVMTNIMAGIRKMTGNIKILYVYVTEHKLS